MVFLEFVSTVAPEVNPCQPSHHTWFINVDTHEWEMIENVEYVVRKDEIDVVGSSFNIMKHIYIHVVNSRFSTLVLTGRNVDSFENTRL